MAHLNTRTTLPLPDQGYLLSFLSYDPQTGVVTYPKTRGRQRTGTVAIPPSIRIDGVIYLVSRIIWKMVTGEDPDRIVDHHDGSFRNNRWTNLRLATVSENNQNSKVAFTSDTQVKGVFRRGKRFVAGISGLGVRTWIGTFNTLEAAEEAYLLESKKRYGQFSVGNRPL